MELKRNQLVFSNLKGGEFKKLKDEGVIERGKKEHWMAQLVASLTIDGEWGVFDIHMTQIGLGDVVNSSDMGILESIPGDYGVVYYVDVAIANRGYQQNEKFFTDFCEAIDYYNKIKAFFKAEVKAC